MNKTFVKICILIILALQSISAFSQYRSAYGVVGNLNANIHTADFRAFPGVPSCCPKFDNGSGSGLGIGALYQLPVGSDMRVALRVTYLSYGGTLTHAETTTLAGNIPGTFEHSVQASLASIGAEPLLQYNLFGSLWFNIGGRAASVTQSTFSQKEVITSPSSGVFSNGLPIRNEVTNAKIPDAQTLNAGVLAGLSYDLPLNKSGTFVIAPEALYYLPLVGIVKRMDWQVSQIRAGIALKWSPFPSKVKLKRTEQKKFIDTVQVQVADQLAGYRIGRQSSSMETLETEDELVNIETIRRTDTLRVAAETLPVQSLAATVTASALEADGKEKPELKIEVEEFSSVLMTPLLNYIFFDENSDVIPSRYKLLDSKGVERFREERINNPDRLVTYYHVLNIIGKRMRLNNTASITLIGCNADVGVEKSNVELSRRRAEAVKKYLVDVWLLSDSRIKIESRNQPAKAANTLTKDGAQENRRVEIYSSDPSITAALITADTFRTVTPRMIRFYTKVVHDNDIHDWRLSVTQDGVVLKRFDGSANVPNYIDWNIGDEIGAQPRTVSSINFKLSVHDTKNRAVSSEGTIAADQITLRLKNARQSIDREINRFSLILFDIRSPELSDQNVRIAETIKRYIKEQSVVQVTGYTDRLGDAAQNQALAMDRASHTAKALGLATDKVTIAGHGNATTYDAELPEGRMYTRTVDIVIETSTSK